jgi:hypothetical protein
LTYAGGAGVRNEEWGPVRGLDKSACHSFISQNKEELRFSLRQQKRTDARVAAT